MIKRQIVEFAVFAVTLVCFVHSPAFAKKSGQSAEEFAVENKKETVKTSEELSLEYAQSKIKEAEEEKAAQLKELERREKERELKKLARDKRREKTDKNLSITYVPEKKYELKAGKLRLSFSQGSGSFNIYAKDEKNVETALFSDYDDSRSTFLMANIDGLIYRLNKDAGVSKELRRLSHGAQLAFSIDKKNQVVADFVPVSSVLGTPEDMVRVSIYSTNLTDKEQTVAIKGIFDTILGEGTDWHFATSSGVKIRDEMQFDTMKKERTVISTNGRTSVQLLFDGKSITPPVLVSFANKNSLEKSSWRPAVVQGKSFNSVLAYNNSAVCVNWPETRLKAGETSTIVFYIACGVDAQVPNGLSFVDSLSAEKPVEIQVREVPKGKVDVKKPEVDFIVPPVSDFQLNSEYIQNLINRINALQSDPKSVDRTEVRQLNAELDAIMEKIRQRN